MVHNLNLWITIGLMSVLFFSTPLTDTTVGKSNMISIPTPANNECTANDIKKLIAEYYNVSPSLIYLSGDLCAYTFQSYKDYPVSGELIYYDCGAFCTLMHLRSFSGENAHFQLTCDFQASDL